MTSCFSRSESFQKDSSSLAERSLSELTSIFNFLLFPSILSRKASGLIYLILDVFCIFFYSLGGINIFNILDCLKGVME